MNFVYQISSAKIKRGFVTCFNVDPVFADIIKFKKSKGGGEFNIIYLLASFNKEAMSGEFYIEFDEYVWEHKLAQCFEKQGAGQVNVITFQNNDSNESATNALLRLHTNQGITYERGTCPDALARKLEVKLAEHAKSSKNKEFDEKTQAAVKQSMAEMEAKLGTVDTKLDMVGDKMETTKTAVAEVGTKIDTVQNGVCGIIPDYQRENEDLRKKLAHKTKECDRIEFQKTRDTRMINEKDVSIRGLQAQVKHLQEEKTALETVVAEHRRHITTIEYQNYTLVNQLNVSNIIADAKEIKDFIENELKRRRTD